MWIRLVISSFLKPMLLHVIPINRFGCALLNDERKRLISFNVKWEKPLSLFACTSHKNLTFGRFNIAPETRDPKKEKRLSFIECVNFELMEKTSFLFIGYTQSTGISIRLRYEFVSLCAHILWGYVKCYLKCPVDVNP